MRVSEDGGVKQDTTVVVLLFKNAGHHTVLFL